MSAVHIAIIVGDLLSSEAPLLEDLHAAVEKANGEGQAKAKQPEGQRERANPKGRHDLFASMATARRADMDGFIPS